MTKKLKRVITALSVIVAIQLFYITGAMGYLGQFWMNLSETVREIVIVGVLLAILVNMFANFIWERLSKQLAKLRR